LKVTECVRFEEEVKILHTLEAFNQIRRDFLERRIINMTQLLEKMRINGEKLL
jgi:hypothetical protein